MLTALDPRKSLSRCLLPGSIDEVRACLTQRLETATLFGFCDQQFPKSFRAAFPKKWRHDQEKLLPDAEAGTLWSEGELKCIELISIHSIPLSYEYVEGMATEEEENGELVRLPTIPLQTYGVDLWNSSDLDENRGWRILAALDENPSVRESGVVTDTPISTFPRDVWSWQVFEATCTQFPEPLSLLPVALEMLNYSTGNVFLDTTDEMPYENSTWTWDDLEWLAEEWAAAQAMTKKADVFLNWLVKHPQRVRKVVDLWNLATWNMLMSNQDDARA